MENKISSDIYDLIKYVREIQKENMNGVEENTLMLGIFGYLAEVFTNTLQNDVVMASEFANEGIPTKAKFEKNIISHALGLGINELNATPAELNCFLMFNEDNIINAIGGGTGEFIFDRENKIFFENFEFHPDYDIVIRRVKLNNGTYTYTAKYRMNMDGVYTNPISNITNPYINPPVSININGTNFIYINCTLRQVELLNIYKKVLSDNTISAKTVNFEFDSQLAGFDVDVTNNSETTHLTPIYEGLSTSGTSYPHIWYTYLDSKVIRLKFDPNSYYPRVSSNISINLQLTNGQSGNFVLNRDDPDRSFLFSSDKYGYNNIQVIVKPTTYESLYGADKKSIEELKQIIPKEALSRGSITNTTDLQNYFNAIDNSMSKLYFYKKKDNCLGRLYYSYIVMKNRFSNIIPTNTLPIVLYPSDLTKTIDTNGVRYTLDRNTIFKLGEDGIARITTETPSDNGFYYKIPYNFVINDEPLYSMYFLTTMDINKTLRFRYINEKCQYQYISTYVNLNRPYIDNNNTYTIKAYVEQNISTDDSMIKVNSSGIIDESQLRVQAVLVLYNSNNEPYRYLLGDIATYNSSAKTMEYKFTMTSDDKINTDNDLYVNNVNQVGYKPDDPTRVTYGYLPANTKAMLHILTYQPEYSTDQTYIDLFDNPQNFNDIIPLDYFKRDTVIEGDWRYPDNMPTDCNIGDYASAITEDSLDKHWYIYTTVSEENKWVITNKIPIYKDWCVSNSYDVTNGLDILYNYSEIVYSDIEVTEENDIPEGYIYKIDNIPMIKYDYFSSELMVKEFFNELLKRKTYIDLALERIEDSFGMDFKFFNTYGPSKMYTLNGADRYLDKVNISIEFRLGLKTNYDENVITYIKDDVKNFVEKINEIDDIHMSNLTTEIENKYTESVKYFEFVKFNNYTSDDQHIYKMAMPAYIETPEMININTLSDNTPDISIKVV